MQATVKECVWRSLFLAVCLAGCGEDNAAKTPNDMGHDAAAPMPEASADAEHPSDATDSSQPTDAAMSSTGDATSDASTTDADATSSNVADATSSTDASDAQAPATTGSVTLLPLAQLPPVPRPPPAPPKLLPLSLSPP